jgi:hypothetical protein
MAWRSGLTDSCARLSAGVSNRVLKTAIEDKRKVQPILQFRLQFQFGDINVNVANILSAPDYYGSAAPLFTRSARTAAAVIGELRLLRKCSGVKIDVERGDLSVPNSKNLGNVTSERRSVRWLQLVMRQCAGTITVNTDGAITTEGRNHGDASQLDRTRSTIRITADAWTFTPSYEKDGVWKSEPMRTYR